MRLPWKRTSHHITLYGKPGCHLCEDALVLLRKIQRRRLLDIEEIDITTDRDLFRRYDIRIPVIVIDDSIELEAPISEKNLRAALS